MGLLKWNHSKVQKLTPWEIWMFIVGRVLVAFGMGALAIQQFPTLGNWLTLFPIILGVVVLIFALKGFLRKPEAN